MVDIDEVRNKEGKTWREVLAEINKEPVGENMFDDWNEIAPNYLNQCSVPDKHVPGRDGDGKD